MSRVRFLILARRPEKKPFHSLHLIVLTLALWVASPGQARDSFSVGGLVSTGPIAGPGGDSYAAQNYTVNLWTPDGQFIAQTVTDANGLYLFPQTSTDYLKFRYLVATVACPYKAIAGTVEIPISAPAFSRLAFLAPSTLICDTGHR